MIEAELEDFLELMQPGWRQLLVRKRFLPAMLAASSELTAAQKGFQGRPDPKMNEVENLYVPETGWEKRVAI
jgi:hypothetical protein